MQRILPFRVFESRVTLTQEQEAWLNQCTGGSWSLNPAGEVDVQGDFNCSNRGLQDFQRIKFGRVSGDFHCPFNKLTSLVGAPQEVGGNFHCGGNKLTSLKGSPQKVEGNFMCYSNELTSLEGAPQEVGGNFECHNNRLTSLAGAPLRVEGDFNCIQNELTSLEGAPRNMKNSFYCSFSRLTSLEGAPREVEGNFGCSGNQLTSLAGAPREVKGEFSSDKVEIPSGQWGLKGWLDAYVTGNEQARKLLLTLIGPDALNQMMQEAPEQTIIDLGPIWNDPAFAEIRAGIRVPDRYRDEMGLLGDLADLGF